ncbi:Zinc finger MYM-type protein 1 [Merluccius polli]|uniref:Zinc finger MYM-type protein 1 n=1 Tax=Merluccius polli TaxID=89951 RepID=A0AA47P4P1_MERPO|nr:Zinc finger MYM-type protein 1 [Merluccius polli]
MAGSLGVLDIERAVIAAVRAAVQGVAPPVQSTSTVSTPASFSNFAATVTSLRSAPLPSIPRRNRAQSGYLRRRNVKIYTKDVCLTFSPGVSVFIIPRGETRTRLATAGLVGKISFSTEWSEDQVRAEITAIFSGAFGLSEHQSLPFQFLSTIKGCKKLMIPKVTSNFPWGDKEVALCLFQHLSVYHGRNGSSCTVTQREAPSRAQREHCERLERVEASAPSDDGMELQGQRGPNEAMNYFADFIPIDIEEDEAIEEAIRRSLLEESVQSLQDSRFAESLSKEEMTGIVKAHSERVVTEAYRPIYISRGNVWTTALRQFSRRKFTQCTDLLYVTFASDEGTNEDGEDLGGPRREFFRLLVKAIFKESGAFEESLNGFTPRMNISHVQNGVYCTIGQMMSTIIVQGGEPPALLSPLAVDYLLTGRIFQLKVTPDDVADMVLREALKNVDQALTTDELEQAVECCDSWRYQLEGLPNPVSMDNKDAFVQNAILFHVLIQRQSCYDQLVEGLKYYEDAFTKVGYTNWKKALIKNSGFQKHVSCTAHVRAMSAWQEYQRRAETDTTIVHQLGQTHIEKNRYYVKSIGEAIQFLMVNELALHGHQCGSGDEEGLFIKLFDYTLQKDAKLAEIAKSIPENAKYTSNLIQNEIIETLAKMVLNEIKTRYGEADSPGLCIKSDGTRDRCNIENVSVIIRFVHNSIPEEHLIGLIQLNQLDAAYVCDQILSHLSDLGYSGDNLVSQCYDGASVMSGVRGGVQALLQNKVGKDIPYVHCYNHQLHLAVVHAMHAEPLAKKFFEWSSSLNTFCHRHYVANTYSTPTLKRLLEICWTKPSDVPADVVATLLKPNYSVLGSNRRPTEELMVVKFREFLHCVQEKELGEHLNARNLTEAEKAFILTLNPGHILAFATGSSKVPAIGYSPSPKLTFVHDDTKHLPIAHTCSNELQIFVNRNNLESFLVALMNGSTFNAV